MANPNNDNNNLQFSENNKSVSRKAGPIRKQ